MNFKRNTYLKTMLLLVITCYSVTIPIKAQQFTRINEGAMVNDGGLSWGVCWVDYDNDEYLDLFVTNYHENNCLYHNNTDGTFTKITNVIIAREGGIQNVRSSGSCTWGDFDNDGDPDLYIANGVEHSTPNNFFYLNDGDLDIFLTRGDYFSTKTNLLFKNDGLGNFERVREGAIATDQNSSNGAAWGDYDRDGDLDLFVSNVLNFNENNALYMNNGNSNNWINIKCIGVQSNKSAIGAKVHLKARIGNESGWQLRHISGQTGKCAQNSLNVHFGLGEATIIDSIKVEWPSGKLTVQENISVNQFITIIEEGSTKVPEIIPNDVIIKTFPNPFTDTITIEYQVKENSQVAIKIYDQSGKMTITLLENNQTPGPKTISWDGTDYSGKKVSSGNYILTINTEYGNYASKIISFSN